MSDKSNESDAQTLCPTCGKRVPDSDRVGSITSYLFQPFLCSCGDISQSLHPANQSLSPNQKNSVGKLVEAEFCPVCGLQKSSVNPGGSITGFLFQSTRCKCVPSGQVLDPKMADRFWQLKQTDGGKTFGSAIAQPAVDNSVRYSAVNALAEAIIGNSYRIIKAIGSGGMGEVYLAKHLTLGKTCALKLIPPDQVTDAIWQRFQIEARTIAALDHVNLVKVTDLGIHEGCLPYYAMEFVDGQTLAQMLKEKGRLPLPAVLEIFKQACDGLDYAHRKGVVHRDLKPGNIMLAKIKDGKYQVKILDFGLVKTIQKDRYQQSLTRVGEVFGTPLYMSPEQCMSAKVDNRSDIYSLGCTIFECLTGRPPFVPEKTMDTMVSHISSDPPTLASILGNNSMPESMEVVLAKLLRKNPVERYQTLSELRKDLVKVEKGETVEPFYVSRNRPKNKDQAKSSGSNKQPDIAPNKNAFGLTGPIVATITITIVLGAMTMLFVAVKLNANAPYTKRGAIDATSTDVQKETPAAQVPDAPVKIEALKEGAPPPESLNDSTPFSTIVTDNGGNSWRVFNFPTDTTIGCLKQSSGGSIGARGNLRYPVNAKLFFIPFPVVCKYPAYLKRFRQGDLYEILPESPSNMRAEDYPGTDVCLHLMAVIPGIRALNLNNCEDMTNKSMKVIEEFHSLVELYMTDKLIDADTLAKSPVLKGLEALSLQGYENAAAVIASLKGSEHMSKLLLEHTRLDLDSIENISTMPKLTILEFDKIKPSGTRTSLQTINLLAKNTKLTKLVIGNLPMDASTVAAMKSLKSLEILIFDIERSGMNKQMEKELIDSLPGVKIQDLHHRDLKNQ